MNDMNKDKFREAKELWTAEFEVEEGIADLLFASEPTMEDRAIHIGKETIVILNGSISRIKKLTSPIDVLIAKLNAGLISQEEFDHEKVR